MKTLSTLAAVVTAAALAGCAAYGDPYATSYPSGVYSTTAVYQGVPGYGPYGQYSQYGQYGQYGAYPTYPAYQGVPTMRGERDRDRDGIPNRIDRDRDGDGVPNEYDRHPYDPSRR
jgi:hypothetical protein